MKIAVITDQHFGARKGSKLFHDYFLEFYNEIFFPYVEENNISTVIDMGDTFDNRRGIDYPSLEWAKKNYFSRLRELGVRVHTLVGNHTAYYKNTNDVNAIDLLLREYENITCYSEATEVKFGRLKILFIPWINKENEEKTYKLIGKSKAKVAMGHLELKGFYANKFVVMDHGDDLSAYKNFKQVFSGHYHTRSTRENINYLGNPYEIYWSDVNDTRGFHIYDTETLEMTPVNNPHKMFHQIYYEDTPYQLLDTTQYKDKIVKIIVRKKSDPKAFEKFVDKLYRSNIAELKIVENFDFCGYYKKDDFEAEESEDTVSILNRYIDESEISLDKSRIKEVLRTIYTEACEVV